MKYCLFQIIYRGTRQCFTEQQLIIYRILLKVFLRVYIVFLLNVINTLPPFNTCFSTTTTWPLWIKFISCTYTTQKNTYSYLPHQITFKSIHFSDYNEFDSGYESRTRRPKHHNKRYSNITFSKSKPNSAKIYDLLG